nr:tetratricopeptide repeat protein [Nonomuraea sp. KC401]
MISGGGGVTPVNLWVTYRRASRLEEAIDAYEGSLAITRDIGDSVGTAIALGHLAEAHRRGGRSKEAVDYFRQALDADRMAGDLGSCTEAIHWWGLGPALDDLGRQAQARACWSRSAELLHELDLIDAAERSAIETSARPRTPEVILRKVRLAPVSAAALHRHQEPLEQAVESHLVGGREGVHQVVLHLRADGHRSPPQLLSLGCQLDVHPAAVPRAAHSPYETGPLQRVEPARHPSGGEQEVVGQLGRCRPAVARRQPVQRLELEVLQPHVPQRRLLGVGQVLHQGLHPRHDPLGPLVEGRPATPAGQMTIDGVFHAEIIRIE